MKIFIYLDESGSIHKNSSMKYFAVGGYFILESEKEELINSYKNIDLDTKARRHINVSKEIKAKDMYALDKIKIFKMAEEFETFYGIAKVFDKTKMRKEIIESNIFYNYAVRLIFEDCILPMLKKEYKSIEFILSLDERNLKIKDLSNLEIYLKMEFSRNDFDFKVTYYDSKSNYGIQMADLVVNTFYNYFKGASFIDGVFSQLLLKKYRVSLFPGGKLIGRRYKID